MHNFCTDILLSIVECLSISSVRMLSSTCVRLRLICADHMKSRVVSYVERESDFRYYVRKQTGKILQILPSYNFVLNYDSLNGKFPVCNVVISRSSMSARCMSKLMSSKIFRRNVKELFIYDFPCTYIGYINPPNLERLVIRGDPCLFIELAVREWTCVTLRLMYDSIEDICASLAYFPRGVKNLKISAKSGFCCHGWLDYEYEFFLKFVLNMRLIDLDISGVAMACCEECMLNSTLAREIKLSVYPPENLTVYSAYDDLIDATAARNISLYF